MVVSIDSFPEDLLIIFFTLILENKGVELPRLRTTLMLTSRDWHRIVYDTASFWTEIHSTHTASQIELALINSRDAGLEIQFEVEDDPGPISGEAFEAVCSHRHRWRAVHLQLHRTPTRSDIDKLQAPAPLLESIHITGPARTEHNELIYLFKGQAPRLKSFHLQRLSISWGKFNAALSDLTSLDLEDIGTGSLGPTLQEIVTVLQASPNLRVLRMNWIKFQPSEGLSTQVDLPNLKTLELTRIDPPIIGSILNAIRCPPCENVIVACDLRMHNEGDDLLHLRSLSNFLPHNSHNQESASLVVTPHSVSYSIAPQPSNACELDIYLHGRRPDLMLLYIASYLPPHILALDTKLHVWHGYANKNFEGAPYHLCSILDAADALHIVRMDVDAEVKGIRHFVQRLSEVRGDRWSLPTLRELSLDITAVPPGWLATMVENRYGVDGTEMNASRLPTPFTLLAIHCHTMTHEVDRTAARKVVGEDYLVWTGPRLDPVMEERSASSSPSTQLPTPDQDNFSAMLTWYAAVNI